MALISTGTKTLDALMEGGIRTKVPQILFGIPNLGKTWACFQISAMCTRPKKVGGLEKKVLYLDTEGFFFTEDVFDRFSSYFEKRWSDFDKSKIEIKQIPSIFDLGNLFGIDFTLKHGESKVTVDAKFPTKRQKKIAKTKGKTQIKETAKALDWVEQAPLYDKLKNKEYGLVVIDSITVPIKSEIVTATQNFPARTSILKILLGATFPFAQRFDVGFLITDHVTRNPMSPGYRYGIGDPWGGQNVPYYVKYIYGLYKPLKDQVQKYAPDGHRVRRVQRYRFPGLDQEIASVMLAKNKGYIDLPGPNSSHSIGGSQSV